MPRLRPRHLVGALGLALVALGLADRLAFVVTPAGALCLLSGLALLTVAMLMPVARRASDVVPDLAFTGLFLLMATAALAPCRQVPLASSLILTAALGLCCWKPLWPRGIIEYGSCCWRSWRLMRPA